MIRILHISDLHASESLSASQEVIVDALIDDVLALHSEKGVDLIVFSGDLAWSGQTDEFLMAQILLLDPLQDKLGLTRDKVIIIPGNHDVDRTKISRVTESGLRTTLRDRDEVNALFDGPPQELEQALVRLAPWELFRQEYYSGVSVREVGRLARIHDLQLDGVAVRVAAMNSAWRSSDDDDKGHLLLGDRQVQAVVSELRECDLPIAVIHHPFTWLADWDARAARLALSAVHPILLSGHEHESDPTAEVTVGGSLLNSRAGCLYQSPSYISAYSVIDVDLPAHATNITMRSWWRQRQEFDEATDIAPRGLQAFTWPPPERGSLSMPNDVVETYLCELAEQAITRADFLDAEPGGSVRDMLVPPRFLGMRYEDYLNALALEESDVELTTVDPAAVLAEGKAVVVVGDGENTGVSSALVWLLWDYYDRFGGLLPVRLEFDPRFGQRRHRKMMERALSRMRGRRPTPDEALPDTCLALDDVRGTDNDALARLGSYMAAASGTRFILGCHVPHDEAVRAMLDEAGVAYEVAHLGPFGRAETRQLATTLFAEAAGNLSDRVISLVSGAGLPRTPLVLNALLVVLRSKDQPETLSLTAIIDAYIDLLLGKTGSPWDDGSGLDHRGRENVLECFAARLLRDGEKRMSRFDAEGFFAEYGRQRLLGSYAPGRALDGLIRRGILVQDADGMVGFRHGVLKYVFGAKAMNDREFEAWVLERPLEFVRVLHHRAGLRRNDEALLSAVLEAADAAVTAAAAEVGIELFDSIRDRPGWSTENEVFEGLRRRLAEETEDEPDDEELEKWDESFQVARRSDVNGDFRLPPLLEDLAASVGLIAGVVRNSELVSNISLKEDALKQAIHGWGLLIVVLAVREDQSARNTESLARMLGVDLNDVDEKDSAKLARIGELLAMFFLILVAVGSLRTNHLEAVLGRVTADDEFMAHAAHAVIASILYCEISKGGVSDLLEKVYSRHRSHPVVREVFFPWMAAKYRQLQDGRLADEIEGFLVNVFLASGDGPASGPRERAARKVEILRSLREGRRRVRRGLGRLPDEVGE